MYCFIRELWDEKLSLRNAALSVAIKWLRILRTERQENVEDPEKCFILFALKQYLN